LKLLKWLFVGMILITTFSSSPLFAEERLKLATTTSTDNSGLLDVLLPPFEKLLNIKVDVIAVGTGKALKLGQSGDVDVVMVHAPAAEKKFVVSGFGVNRRGFMYNDFVILGPESDPARIKGVNNAVGAFALIARNKSTFVSRGDESGTHKKEKTIWKKAGISPSGKWYLETGLPMGQVLVISDQKGAYTLSDRGTYIAFRDKISLKILNAGDPLLNNPYSIIAVNPALHPHVNYMKAMALIAWVTSQEGQKIIATYEKGGELLFHPTTLNYTN